ncbi:MAG: hypothetical protein ABW185_10405 [Sedimenticola sp.]
MAKSIRGSGCVAHMDVGKGCEQGVKALRQDGWKAHLLRRN